MITNYLCDDDKNILKKYNRQIQELSDKNGILVRILTFQSGEELLFYAEEAPQEADIIYLDIMMGALNGLDTGQKLRALGCGAELIFLTSNSDYVFDSFDVSPSHYILKDSVSDARFEEIYLRIVKQVRVKAGSVFSCSNGSVQKKIPIDSISYFEVRNRVVTVHYDRQNFDFYAKLEDLQKEEALNFFIRNHRSYLVHPKYISQIKKNTLYLATGQELPIGITYLKEVKLALSHYLNRS